MKSADQVLALRRVDARLAADRESTWAQKRRGDLHQPHTAAHTRGRESGEVADHAASERHHDVVTGDARRDDRLADLSKSGIGLRALADRDGVQRRVDARAPTRLDRSRSA